MTTNSNHAGKKNIETKKKTRETTVWGTVYTCHLVSLLLMKMLSICDIQFHLQQLTDFSFYFLQHKMVTMSDYITMV